MYSLTLTKAERKAIDWIGDRYAHGYELYDVLMDVESDHDGTWCDDVDITFDIPEHSVWEILNIREESDGRWDCFADEFVAKLEAFCNNII